MPSLPEDSQDGSNDLASASEEELNGGGRSRDGGYWKGYQQLFKSPDTFNRLGDAMYRCSDHNLVLAYHFEDRWSPEDKLIHKACTSRS